MRTFLGASLVLVVLLLPSGRACRLQPGVGCPRRSRLSCREAVWLPGLERPRRDLGVGRDVEQAQLRGKVGRREQQSTAFRLGRLTADDQHPDYDSPSHHD